MASTRTQLRLAVGAAVLGIVGVAGFAYQSLGHASQEVDTLQQQLERIRVVARLEQQLHTLDAVGSGETPDGEHERMERRLARVEALDWNGPEVPDLVSQLGRHVRAQLAAPTAERRWTEPERLVSEVEERAIAATLDESDEALGKRHESAWRLAQLAGGATLVFAILASLVYARLRREREDALRRIRRNDRLAAIGTIAASMAHELNNPLATIAGCAAAIADRIRRGGGDADSVEYIEMVEDETRRCTGIVSSLRDLARDTPLAVTNADLGQLGRDVAALVEMSREPKRVQIELDLAEGVEAVCDPDKIKQLLLNLLLNAREASPEDGRIHLIVARADGSTARLEVHDEGRGIPRKELPRVFDAFHTDKAKGLGIGLFLCQRIVDLHGGTIRAESDGTGKGARFTVLLPTRLED